ncbi:molybdopterin molybdotransferase MoeA [Roseibium litorale]|uniref:Molybdopterin molybdenumtransferase n=1 Tax=Roseibium litorale TaxID=2803841 RepID=A0ABR9CJ91_9HYPH|nr:gephyrin-like molybdotransferase Glp [Roseibium litorale]MBD8890709.1 molybdopterin molybdotransferase MoeA [Roseibium litorale]
MAGNAPLIPVSEALERLLKDVHPLGRENVPLSAANGRILALDLASKRTQPPFAASAMDGYAVRHADVIEVPATLTLIGEAPAGHGFTGTVQKGETVRIFTGAPVPKGADTVVIQENTGREGSQVTVLEAPKPGANIRAPGLDFAEGDLLLSARTRLDYRSLSLAAAMNHAVLPVQRKPLVAVLATGDELVTPGGEPGPDQIIASNHAGIAAMVEDCGGAVLDLGISPDDVGIMASHVRRAVEAKADVLVTLGGASVGDHDLVQDVLGGEGMELAFWKIAMRPGKPLMAGHLGGTKVLGLPGNPVSSIVCALLFLKPLLAKMLNQPGQNERLLEAMVTADLRENDRRQDYIRALLSEDADGRLTVSPFPTQDSSMLSLLARAGALIVRPPHAPAAKSGDRVPIVRL